MSDYDLGEDLFTTQNKFRDDSIDTQDAVDAADSLCDYGGDTVENLNFSNQKDNSSVVTDSADEVLGDFPGVSLTFILSLNFYFIM